MREIDAVLVRRAADGDAEALEAVLRGVQDDVYLLLCLDREHRAAFILGDVFELPGGEAAEVLGVTPAAYRKRLSRARSRVQAFMREHCGLVEPANPCNCRRRIGAAVRHGRVHPDRLLFARDVRVHVDQMERLHDAAAVFRSHPPLRAPERVADAILRIIGARA